MGIRENFFHRNKQKNWVNRAWITQKNGVNQSMLISHLLFIKQIRCFYWPSRGRTKQLKADTVALAKTWQGAPHTAAEMFLGENPAPNTCTSLPPRWPLKTKWGVYHHRGKYFFSQNSSPCFLTVHPSFHAHRSPHNWPGIPNFLSFLSLSSELWSPQPSFCQTPVIFNNLLKVSWLLCMKIMLVYKLFIQESTQWK